MLAYACGNNEVRADQEHGEDRDRPPPRPRDGRGPHRPRAARIERFHRRSCQKLPRFGGLVRGCIEADLCE